jgi:D-alanyl-lipoteichoic acid acyltransferase DltB (MBOAT superfamily)
MISGTTWEVPVLIAVVAALFWCLPVRWRWSFLSIATVAVLGWVAPASAVLLVGVTVSSYVVMVARPPDYVGWLYVFAVFAVMLALRAEYGGWMWFGAAFYVLKAIHATVEVQYKRQPAPRFTDYAAYMLFLPEISIGPVDRLPHFLREKERCRWNPAMVSAGLEAILYGYAQIVLLADYLLAHKLGNAVVIMPPGALREWLECVQFGGQLYFKFAGFSDIAIGFALLVGIRAQPNFNRPYRATNILEFWRRWHMSVTSWCRDYVNRPVLAVTRSRAAAAVAAMLVLGLWHELSLRYILWGLYHGAGIACWLGWRGLAGPALAAAPAWSHRIGHLAAWLVTMVFVVAGFAITKEPTVAQSLRALGALFGLMVL